MPVDELAIGTPKVPKGGTGPHLPGSVSAILGTIKQPMLIRKRESVTDFSGSIRASVFKFCVHLQLD